MMAFPTAVGAGAQETRVTLQAQYKSTAEPDADAAATTMSALPVDVQGTIARNLSIRELSVSRAVCNDFREIGKETYRALLMELTSRFEEEYHELLIIPSVKSAWDGEKKNIYCRGAADRLIRELTDKHDSLQ